MVGGDYKAGDYLAALKDGLAKNAFKGNPYQDIIEMLIEEVDTSRATCSPPLPPHGASPCLYTVQPCGKASW